MPCLQNLFMYFAQEFGCCEFLCVRTRNSKRLIGILNKSFDESADDFNLTNMIIDYKERQRERVLTRMKDVFRELFITNPQNEINDKLKNSLNNKFKGLFASPAGGKAGIPLLKGVSLLKNVITPDTNSVHEGKRKSEQQVNEGNVSFSSNKQAKILTKPPNMKDIDGERQPLPATLHKLNQ